MPKEIKKYTNHEITVVGNHVFVCTQKFVEKI